MNKKLLFSLAHSQPRSEAEGENILTYNWFARLENKSKLSFSSLPANYKPAILRKIFNFFSQNCGRATKLRGFLFLILLGVLILPSVTMAQAPQEPQTIADVVNNISKALELAAVGVVTISWVIVAVLFLTSVGNPERLGTAKKALAWTIVGTALFVLLRSMGIILRNVILRGI